MMGSTQGGSQPSSPRARWKALPAKERRALQRLIAKRRQPLHVTAQMLEVLAWRARRTAMIFWFGSAQLLVHGSLVAGPVNVGSHAVSGASHAAIALLGGSLSAVGALRFRKTARAYADAANKLRARANA